MAQQESIRPKVPQHAMSADMARRAAEATAAKSKEFGAPVSIAVVDDAGHLVYFLRADGCAYLTFETAKGKAALSAAFRRPSREFVEAARENPGFWLNATQSHGMIIGAGGYPITRDGVLIGGIGCGGATGDEDHLCAEAGAKAVSS